MIFRKFATLGSSTIVMAPIENSEGESYKMSSITTFRTNDIDFTVGKEFEETRMDKTVAVVCLSLLSMTMGLICALFPPFQSTIVKEGDNKLVQKQITKDNLKPEVNIVREFTPAGMVYVRLHSCWVNLAFLTVSFSDCHRWRYNYGS